MTSSEMSLSRLASASSTDTTDSRSKLSPEGTNEEEEEGDEEDDDAAAVATDRCASRPEKNIAQAAATDRGVGGTRADGALPCSVAATAFNSSSSSAADARRLNQIKSSESEANIANNNNTRASNNKDATNGSASAGARCATEVARPRHQATRGKPDDSVELAARDSPAGATSIVALENRRSNGASRDHSSSLCDDGDGGTGECISEGASPAVALLRCKFDGCPPAAGPPEAALKSVRREQREQQQQFPDESALECAAVMGKRLGRPAAPAAQVPPAETATIEFQQQQASNRGPPSVVGQLAQRQPPQPPPSPPPPPPPATSNREIRPKRARTPLGTSREDSIAGSSPARQQQHSSNGNKLVIAPAPGRPASAMAGSLAMAQPATCTPVKSATPNHRVKTTRVRINSTSEQIQDPNWLIQMSREYEAQQSQHNSKRMFAFRSLQQKLKSTIVGGSGGGGGGSGATAKSSEPSQAHHQNDNQSGQASGQEAAAAGQQVAPAGPPPVPVTPVKVPVSILKQPSAGQASQRLHASAASTKMIAQPSTGCNKPAAQDNSPAPARPSSRAGLAPAQTQAQPARATKRDSSETAKPSGRQSAGSGKIRSGQVDSDTVARQQPAPSASASQRQVKQVGVPAPLNAPTSGAGVGASCGPSQSQPAGGNQSPPGASQQHRASVRPICADGQVKVSGWKRNNLLAKTLSHFDEIRGNQRPIFVPTKIMLLPSELESCAPQASSAASSTSTLASQQVVPGGGSLAARNQSLLSSPPAPGANKFADIVREALLKKNLLGASTSPNHQPATAASSAVKRASDANQHQSSRNNSPSRTEIGAGSPAKRSMSAEPGRLSVSSLGRDSTGGSTNQSRRRQQLHLDPSESLTSQQQQQQQQQQHQQQQHQHLHDQQSQAGSRPASSTVPSMAQIIAAAVAASSGDIPPPTPASQRGSFSMASSSSSRAFKLQLKNEQVLQNLRRQSNEHHRESLVSNSAAGSGLLAEGETGGGTTGGHAIGSALNQSSRSSVRLRDWKRLTTKLGLLTGRVGERQAFAGAVRSAAGTPTPSHISNNQSQPLRLTVSNQESASRQRRGNRRGSNEHGAAQASSYCSSGGRLLVPGDGGGGGGCLFDVPNRRHSSQTCVSAEPDSGERKLSSSSMVVTSLTARHDNANLNQMRLGLESRLGASNAGGGGGGGRRIARSAAASPMLVAHQDSICLRRSSDSEACERTRASKLVAGVNPSGASPATEASDRSPLSVRNQSSPAGSSASSGDAANRQLRATASDSSATGATKTPVVVNRDDLIHLLQVTNSSGVSLAVSQPTDDCSCCERRFNSAAAASCPCTCHSAASISAVDQRQSNTAPEQPIGKDEAKAGSYRTTAAERATPTIELVDDSGGLSRETRHEQGLRGEARRRTSRDEAPETSAARQAGLNDLSSVVKRTSKVAYFQQKLRKMRWHSKQQQREEEEGEQAARQRAEEKAPIDRDDNLMINEQVGDGEAASRMQTQRKAKNGTHDKQADLLGDEASAVPAKQIGGDVFMDPTLIGDAIEIFLRTTMQQQQQQQQQHKHKQLGPDDNEPDERAAVPGGNEDDAHDDGDKRTLPPIQDQVLLEPVDKQKG